MHQKINDITRDSAICIDFDQDIDVFYELEQAVYPVVIVDTIKYEDIKIAQLNVNKYSYMRNPCAR